MERDGSVMVGQRDIPLFYERVIKHILPYCRLMLEDVDFKDYEPEPLKVSFRFDTGEDGALVMEPTLAYSGYEFHPLEDEKLPRTICRDVPGEFKMCIRDSGISGCPAGNRHGTNRIRCVGPPHASRR